MGFSPRSEGGLNKAPASYLSPRLLLSFVGSVCAPALPGLLKALSASLILPPGLLISGAPASVSPQILTASPISLPLLPCAPALCGCQDFLRAVLSMQECAWEMLQGREGLVLSLLTKFGLALLDLVAHDPAWQDDLCVLGPRGLHKVGLGEAPSGDTRPRRQSMRWVGTWSVLLWGCLCEVQYPPGLKSDPCCVAACVRCSISWT